MPRWISAAIALLVLVVPATYAQAPRSGREAFPSGRIEGRVLDEQKVPILGAMVSVVGRTTAAAVTGKDGRFSLNELPLGPYVLSVHSRGYWRSQGRTIQLTNAKVSVPEIQLARASSPKPPVSSSLAPQPTRAPQRVTELAGFGVDTASVAAEPVSQVEPAEEVEEDAETAWRLRHLPRSILKEASVDPVWEKGPKPAHSDWFSPSAAAMVPIAFFAELPLSGQFNLMTVDSFDHPGDMLSADSARNVAYVSVNTRAAGGAWSMKGAMTQGDLSSWIVAGSYRSIQSGNHAYELGLLYSTQRYEGGNAMAMAAIRDSARNVGSVYGFDQWTISPRLIVGYGGGFARYDYLDGDGLWSPRLSVTIPINGLRVKALASQRAVVPGAEEFAPSVTGLWLPPERTFSSFAADGSFTPELTRHFQLALERDLAPGVTVSLRGFTQQVADQLVEVFGVDLPGRPAAPVGHYYVGTAGDVDARGWGIGMVQEVPGYVRGTIEYTVATAHWSPAARASLPSSMRSARFGDTENVYDLQTTIEVTIPQTATRVSAKYRMNTAFWDSESDRVVHPNSNGRFNVRVSQSLPFLRFSNADWEMLMDVRNMFRENEVDSSIYDEALALRAPKRVVGGLLVRF